ncbi:MAG: succinate dehydrogenase, cytochrome b556 subunit [Pseudomonadota bacterium]
MSDTSNTKIHQRPLSPHLQVYRLPITAILSICHRASGIVLALGAVLVTAWLVAAAMGEEQFNFFMNIAKTPIGIFILFGWSAALFYHMCSGIRHLMMDVGFWIKERSIGEGVAFVVIGAILLTGGTWYYAASHIMAPTAEQEAANE